MPSAKLSARFEDLEGDFLFMNQPAYAPPEMFRVYQKVEPDTDERDFRCLIREQSARGWWPLSP
ncbi:MAG: hypothetical protein JRI66_08050 [Deltaproteobacteria bacterium]|nr:hypothetical protein [Deltaproteobacteria bacterium]